MLIFWFPSVCTARDRSAILGLAYSCPSKSSGLSVQSEPQLMRMTFVRSLCLGAVILQIFVWIVWALNWYIDWVTFLHPGLINQVICICRRYRLPFQLYQQISTANCIRTDYFAFLLFHELVKLRQLHIQVREHIIQYQRARCLVAVRYLAVFGCNKAYESSALS